VAISVIDKVGRRVLLLVGSAGMAVTLGTLSAVFGSAPVSNGQPVLGHTAGIIALLAANLFVVFFGVSWGPAVWVLLGEMFNNKIRASALGLAAAAQWLANFAISTSFPKFADIGLAFAYGFYTFFAVLSFFFVAKFVKETKGRQLEDM
jgi:MFS transporter, SP family, sugar:H+ symporter